GVAVGADDFGQGTHVAGDEGGTASHGLGGGQGEPFVEGRDDGDLGTGDEITECGVVDAVDEGHAVTQAEFVDEPVGGATGFGFADDGEVDVVSLLGQTCDGAQEDGHALEGTVGAGGADDAAGYALGVGAWAERAGVHTRGRAEQARGGGAGCPGDVGGGGLGGHGGG